MVKLPEGISNPSLSLGGDHGGSTELLAGHRCAVPRRRERKGASAARGPGSMAEGRGKWGENGDVAVCQNQ